MKRNPRPCFITIFSALAVVVACAVSAQEQSPLLERKWFEARTMHFQTFSCGETQAVARLAGRLEQFRISYSLLAGTQSVASPPIVVMAFPDHESLEPFLPVYQGKPANLAAFFSRGSDENLIALSLSDSGTSALQPIFHEYTHLLLRHNEQFWPMWLQEGMADIYGAFEVAGEHTVRIGGRQPVYVAFLSQTPLMPLQQLFAVTQDSPGYNERDRQGIFYAESWLLTQYLMLGDNPAYKARFGQLTVLLRQGQPVEEAFTNAFHVTLPVFERQLQQYFEQGRFDTLSLSVPTSLYSPQAMTFRAVGPVEACFRLGDQLLRLGRFEPAKAYFTQARKLAPASPLPYEGLGLQASEQHEHAQAVQFLGEAVRRGSVSFLAHYVYAREKFRLTAKAPSTYTRLSEADAADIRKEVEKSLALMPNFGPAHHLLGFLEFLQGEDFATAAQHLRRAIELEPENPAYPLTLAQAQIFGKDLAAARRTLEPLRRPYVDAEVRSQAEELLQETQR